MGNSRIRLQAPKMVGDDRFLNMGFDTILSKQYSETSGKTTILMSVVTYVRKTMSSSVRGYLYRCTMSMSMQMLIYT